MKWIFTFVFIALSVIVVAIGGAFSVRNFIYANRINREIFYLKKEILQHQKKDSEINILKKEIKNLEDTLNLILEKGVDIEDTDELLKSLKFKGCEVYVGDYRKELLKEREFHIFYTGEFQMLDIMFDSLIQKIRWIDLDSMKFIAPQSAEIFGKVYAPFIDFPH